MVFSARPVATAARGKAFAENRPDARHQSGQHVDALRLLA
ncbi:hypothetical protein EIB18_09735 [Caulobacter vibrioides]|nr:hypothetical protein [Caulobacter vibrioides]AVG21543.1 hypothetical protein CA608_20245 [Caulobacter vibrioides]AZH12964.1 hypothetical protein EIB18_09735 [Caulobacter vibrioides]PLR09577.1 hypothetical protein CVUC_15285 [Caulobacter vibrioides]